MAGIDNLVPPGRGFTAEEHSAGGEKSGEVRRLRAAVRKQLATKVPKKGMEVGDKTLDRLERIPLEDKLDMIDGIIHEFAKNDG